MTKQDERVDSYIQTLPTWQQDICNELRRIIHISDPEIEETIKRTSRPYFVLQGNVCALQATRDHVNLFVYDPIAEDKEKVINQGAKNATARSIQIYKFDEIHESGILSLLKSVIANNKLGGWRKLKRS